MPGDGMWGHRDRSSKVARERLLGFDLLAGLGADELDLVDRLLTDIHVDVGEHLTVEGGTGRDFVMIIEGLASVVQGDDEVARLGEGEVLGEHAMLTHMPRTADVVALTPMRLLVAGPAEFARLLDGIPAVAERLAAIDQQRQSEG